MPKKTIDIKADAATEKGNLKTSSSVDVNAGPIHGSSSSGVEVGKSGYKKHTSNSSSLGGVLGSSNESSEAWTSKGFSGQKETKQNLFGLKSEGRSNLDVNKNGVSLGEHGKIAGQKFGYSAHIPNPTNTIKQGVQGLKQAAGNVPHPDMAHEAASLASQAAEHAGNVGKFAESLAKEAGKVDHKGFAKFAADAAKLAGQAAHLASGAGKVALDVAKVGGGIAIEVIKALK